MQIDALEERRMLATFAPLPSADDGDAESLRSAVIAANSNGEAGDTITLAAGTYALTIANTAGQENLSAEGDLDVRFDPAAPVGEAQTIIFQGAGAEMTIIDGAALGDRVFQILGDVTVIFRDLTITGGAAKDDGLDGRLPGQSESRGGGILAGPLNESDSVTLDLDMVRVLNNTAHSGGGAYLIGVTIDVANSFISDNRAQGTPGISGGSGDDGGNGGSAIGGGILLAGGMMMMSNSTVSDNIAMGGDGGDGGDAPEGGSGGWGGIGGDAMGGGIAIHSGGALNIVNSTLSGNVSDAGDGGGGGAAAEFTSGGWGGDGGGARGGGIYALSGELSLTNLTVSGNSARGGEGGQGGFAMFPFETGGNGGNGGSAWGGGLFLNSVVPAAAYNATIAANAAYGGPEGAAGYYLEEDGQPGTSIGGGVVASTYLVLENTLIGDNVAYSARDVDGAIAFANASLFETAPSGGVATSGTTPNLIGLDPKLGPLQDNGGSTMTHALLPGSPALDAGIDASSTVLDQRGFPRPVNLAGVANAMNGDASDIGAYESQAPLAADDVAVVSEDDSVVTDVLANDDPGLIVISVSDPTHGTAVINSDGTITYLPDADYNGQDAFIYTAVDALGGSVAAGVFVTVDPVNDLPVATPDSATTNEDEMVVIDVLANDSDVESATLTVIATTDPKNGSIVLGEEGAITYTPNADYYGADAFSYTVSDENGGESTTTVSVTVNPVNDAPAAIILSSDAVDENVLGAAVGEVTVIDPDPDDTHQLTVSDDRFEIVGGTLKLKDGAYLDFEAEAIVTLEISAADSGAPPATLTQEFIIAVNDVFEPIHPWQNQDVECDVNGDGLVSIADLLEIVAALREHGPAWELPLEFPPDEGPPPYLDVDGDDMATLTDLLAVVQQLREDLGDPAPA